MFDLLIKNGKIIDGTGKPGFRCDIGISGAKIIAVGALPDACATKIIDAEGYTVTPGFIDIHRHADAALFRKGFGNAELSQGLTTIVNGNCGLSIAPFRPNRGEAIRRYLQPVLGELNPSIETGSMKSYLSSLSKLPVNIGMLARAGTIRTDALGYDAGDPSDGQIAEISHALENALSEGALGVSLGLGYAPECFYSTEQLIRVLSLLSGGNISITAHMRQEGDGVVSSVKEMICISESLKCPVHISHLKAMGKRNWQKSIPEILMLIEQANDSGLKIDFDVYPYTAGSTQLMICMPPEFLAGGPEALCERLKNKSMRKLLSERIETGTDFDNIVQLAGWDGIYITSVHSDKNRIYCGKNLAEIADIMHRTPLDACCDLLIEECGRITMIDFMADETDIETIIRHPLSNIISDATYPTSGLPHPRVYGTFARMIERYVCRKAVLSLEEAVLKMTSQPAAVLNLKGKGVIAEGMDADICVFEPNDIRENADYSEPTRLSSGMHAVIVNGQMAYTDGNMTDFRYGDIIRS